MSADRLSMRTARTKVRGKSATLRSALTPIELATQAYDDGVWERALRCYHQAETEGAALSAADLERMAGCAWLVGDPAGEPFARACEGFEAAGQPHDAARVAITLVDYYALIGEYAKSKGWLRRAARMLEGVAEGTGHARLALMQGFVAVLSGKVEEALEKVEQAHELARRHKDEDTEALSLSRRAALLLRLGRVDEATEDVDEAMLLVHRDRATPVTGAMVYCNTIDFCRDLGDFERALEWTEAATRWTIDRNVCGFPGVCRVHRAELLRLQGEHLQAEAEVRAALDLFSRHRFRFGIGYAMAELGTQRLEIDALEAAQQAFREAAAVGHEPLPGGAVLALRRGDPKLARSLLDTALDERRDNPLGRARLLPTMVCACLALDDLKAAAAAADELQAVARRVGTAGTQAQAGVALARVHLAVGDAAAAVRAARSATRAWTLIGACYELAQARDVLAQAYEATGDTVRAEFEREQVRATQQQLSSAATALASGSAMPPRRVAVAPPRPRPIAETRPIREGMVLEGKIAIGKVLGFGGMGIVHAGKHLVTGRDVAVKVLTRSVCGDQQRCARFLQEAKACGRIRHPNVVDIYDAGLFGDEPYIVMELLRGRTLEELMARGEGPAMAEALGYCEQAARGVAAAHAAGVIHRDLKPANIIVCGGGVKVLDFGISKQREGGNTKPGQLLGTPFYMAPEQILSPQKVDERTDVFALGVVLFELLTGRLPFVGHSQEDGLAGGLSWSSIPVRLHAIAEGPKPELTGVVPAHVEAVVCRALASDPAERYGSAEQLAGAIAAAAKTLCST